MESTLATLAVGRGGLPALAFVASHQALLPRAKALWGEHDAGGSPRWRSAIAVPMRPEPPRMSTSCARGARAAQRHSAS